MKTFRIIKVFFLLAFQRDLIYRFSAFFNLFSVATYISTFVFSLQFISRKIPEIMGYDYDQLYMILMLGQLWWLVNMIFARKNYQILADYISQGNLDFYLLKPMQLRRIFPFWQIDLRQIFPTVFVLGLILVKIDLRPLSWWQIGGAILFFFNGVLMIYSLTSIFTSFTFWVGRNNAIFDITIELPDLIRLPIEFFPLFFKGFFLFVIPAIVFINPTFGILYGTAKPWLLVWAIVVSGLLYGLSELVWRQGLRKYTSAN